jgi:Ricin-type beta-trefoil lectin domain
MKFWRKIAGYGLPLAMLTTAGVTLASPAQATTYYFHWKNTSSGTCWDAQYADPGTRVLMWSCVNTEFEEWATLGVPVARPNETAYMFVNHAMNMCLAVDSDTPENGTPVIQQTCNESDPKQWWWVDISSNMRIHAYLNFVQVLDVDGGQGGNGVPLQTWDQSVSNQRWTDDV